MSQKHTAEGWQRGLEDEMRRIKSELKDDMYKDAEAQYRDKIISLKVSCAKVWLLKSLFIK